MATIYCFSSTGNSLHIAKQIASKLNANIISMTKDVRVCTDNIIGFVFPVYFWNLPKLVKQFVAQLDIQQKDSYIFSVISYGGACYGVSGLINQILERRGVSLSYSAKIKTVENYLPAYRVNNTSEVQRKTESQCKLVTEDLIQKKQKLPKNLPGIHHIFYRFFPGRDASCDVHFQISDTCTHCGICRRICPVQNIRQNPAQHPSFLHHCEDCLACLHACPAQAINWKKSTIGKQRYRHPVISQTELMRFLLKESEALD